jgi:hypothetical protein
MGCLKEKAIDRQNKGEKLHFYVFDCLAWGGESWLKKTAKSRFTWVSAFAPIDYVSFAQYVSGADLWSLLQEILARGDEGIVITKEDGLYEPGKRPSKTTLKIKKELQQTIDCFFTGVGSAPTHIYTGKEIEGWQYWENSMTGDKINGQMYKEYKAGCPLVPVTKGYYHGWCGSMEIAVLKKCPTAKTKINGVVYDGYAICPLGWLSGLPDEMKADPKKYAFRPIEVTAMEFDAIEYTLRHGKMVGWRNDLTIGDCTLEKIEG